MMRHDDASRPPLGRLPPLWKSSRRRCGVFPLPAEPADGRGNAGGSWHHGQLRNVRQWGLKFGRDIANNLRRRASCRGDKWHLDEVVLTIAGKRHYLWRAVDRDGFVLDVLVQSRRDRTAAKRLLRKLMKAQGRAPRVMVTDKLKSYAAARREIMPGVEHRQHKGINNGQRTRINRPDGENDR